MGSATTDKSILKAVKKLPLGMVQNSVTFTIKNKPLSVSEIVGGVCTNGSTTEVGFGITRSLGEDEAEGSRHHHRHIEGLPRYGQSGWQLLHRPDRNGDTIARSRSTR